ncbi:hypothetical protein [Paracoccus sediminilitoris]|uniref:hypothetical protein n=1 Tax=Paracoccus sediminilitoris TaxID=2202419 RepID=UPI000DBA3489|nr:hypothetical protein [Paracoccus sediminilitoris]
MTLSKLASSAALIALVAGAPMLTMVSAAQAQDAPAAEQMPDVLQGLDLQNVETETARGGHMRYEGEMADGTEIEALFDRDGTLMMFEADDGVVPATVLDAAVPAEIRNAEAFDLLTRIEELHSRGDMLGLKGEDKDGEELHLMFDLTGKLTGIATDDTAVPQDIVATLLPQTVRDSDIAAQFAVIDHVMSGSDRVMIGGEDADGEDLRAQFDMDGNLLRFGRGDDDRGDHRMHGDRMGRGGHGGPGEHRGPGKHGGKHDDHARGPRHDDRGMMKGDEALMDMDAVTTSLTEAGYTDLGKFRRKGPGAAVSATNPDGEEVMLQLSPEGEVMRETAR